MSDVVCIHASVPVVYLSVSNRQRWGSSSLAKCARCSSLLFYTSAVVSQVLRRLLVSLPPSVLAHVSLIFHLLMSRLVWSSLFLSSRLCIPTCDTFLIICDHLRCNSQLHYHIRGPHEAAVVGCQGATMWLPGCCLCDDVVYWVVARELVK